MKKLLLVLMFVPLVSFGQKLLDNTLEEAVTYTHTKDYYPYLNLTTQDTLILPINIDVELSVESLRDLNLKSNYFYIRLKEAYYTKSDSVYITKSLDTIKTDVMNYVQLIYPESDQTFIGGVYFDGKINDSTYQYTNSLFEGVLPHKWDLRNYPFDNQQLKIRFRALEDSSYISLNVTKLYSPSLSNDFPDLMDGFSVEGISFKKRYLTDLFSMIETSEGIQRNLVVEEIIFLVDIDRKGSFLYFKLFFGAFLSFIISCLVFFISRNLFETRITLSLGGIFGAVGNKYFVESAMPEIQVLTKADLINNLVILLIIINVFIVIAQQNKEINLGALEKNKNAALFMVALFIITNSVIILF